MQARRAAPLASLPRRLGVALAFLALLLLAGPGPLVRPAHAADGELLGEGLVRCYDPELGTIAITANCHGEVVSEAQAETIEKQREARVRAAVEAKPLDIPGRKLRALGSAFVVSAEGLALTNNHVVAGCAGLTARGPEGGAEATLLATDPALDLALLASHLPARSVATFRGPGPLPEGSFAGAVGYPDLGLPTVVAVMTPGRVLGLVPHVGKDPVPALVFRADVRHGDSGGPVLDGQGAVIGVTRAEVNTPAVYRKLHRVIADVGLAVPEASVVGFLERHHVHPRIQANAGSGERPAAELLERARPYVLQIGCWK